MKFNFLNQNSQLLLTVNIKALSKYQITLNKICIVTKVGGKIYYKIETDLKPVSLAFCHWLSQNVVLEKLTKGFLMVTFPVVALI